MTVQPSKWLSFYLPSVPERLCPLANLRRADHNLLISAELESSAVTAPSEC